MNPRNPIRGLVIALTGAALVLPTAALAGNGGVSAPTPGPSGPVDPSFALSTRHAIFLGKSLQISGTERSAAGRTVSIETRQGDAPWITVLAVPADAAGNFTASWRPATFGQFQVRGVLAGSAQASNASSSSAPRTVVVYKPARATWYGPGFYGRKTACGKRLTRSLVGVANRRLPCGTQVEISYRGHRLVAPVVDRGPFAHHAQWDLTAAAAKRLEMTVTSRIGAAPLDLSQEPSAL